MDVEFLSVLSEGLRLLKLPDNFFAGLVAVHGVLWQTNVTADSEQLAERLYGVKKEVCNCLVFVFINIVWPDLLLCLRLVIL